MLEQLRFYTKHSLNDMRVNGQRTFFALLCIAAGVAAIVSLQTLAVMIGDTLTGNLQENNRGDIALNVGAAGPEAAEDRESTLQRGVDDGVLIENEITFFGQTGTDYYLGEDGIGTLQSWLDANYPGATFTYRQAVTNELELFFGSGNGTSLTDPATGDFISQVNPIVIDAGVYPFYGEVQTLDGSPLGEVLTAPTDIVVNQRIAGELSLEIGDEVVVGGAGEPFTVRGIVDNGEEVRNIGSDLFNSLFGFYYLDLSAISQFSDVGVQANAGFIRLPDATPEAVNQAERALNERFPYFETTTTEDLREDYTDLSAAIEDLVSVMGLVSMLIGSIGIINTMQVIVRRRTVEVAVLKTIGLQANQVTTLFLVEALIMGVIGSIAGIILGWGATFVVRGAAETLVATELPFQFVPSAALNGFIIGVLVTVVFGFLPTLTAGQVRPGIVLRPSDAVIPRAGLLRTLGALVFIIVALILIAAPILGSVASAVPVVVGAFIGVGVLYVFLNLMVWLVGRLLPTFGFVDLKISLRQMLAGRQRAAITLLALVIGVFSLSVITLFAQAISNLLSDTLDNAAGGNVAVTASDANTVPQIQETIAGLEGVNSFFTLEQYSVEFVSLEEGDTGDTLDLAAIGRRLENADLGPFVDTDAEEEAGNAAESRADVFQAILSTIDGRSVDELPTDRTLAAGRFLTPEDAGQPVMVLKQNTFVTGAGIDVGDRLTFALVIDGEPSDQTITFEVVGMEASDLVQIGFDSTMRAPRGAFPDSVQPTNTLIITDIDEDAVPELRREVATLPGVFILDTNFITQIVEAILGTFTAFPTMIALLGLVVGGVVIANSVALTTMERRREIAVMKAVGLHRERVLGMILLENGVLGLVGGLVGVGIGLVALVLLINTLAVPTSAIPGGTALLLMLLCVFVALVAAITTAWSASGEKPLTVLRAE